MVTDGWFLSGLDEFLFNRFNNNKSFGNTYVYLFNHRGDGSFTDQLMRHGYDFSTVNDFNLDYHNMNDVTVKDKIYGQKYNFGVSHNDNIMYLFPIVEKHLNHRVMSYNDRLVQQLMTNFFVDFAYTGNPTAHSQEYKWTFATKYPIDYFRIGNYNKDTWFDRKDIFIGKDQQLFCGMETGFFEERVQFWRKFNMLRNQGTNFDHFIKIEL